MYLGTTSGLTARRLWSAWAASSRSTSCLTPSAQIAAIAASCDARPTGRANTAAVPSLSLIAAGSERSLSVTTFRANRNSTAFSERTWPLRPCATSISSPNAFTSLISVSVLALEERRSSSLSLRRNCRSASHELIATESSVKLPEIARTHSLRSAAFTYCSSG